MTGGGGDESSVLKVQQKVTKRTKRTKLEVKTNCQIPRPFRRSVPDRDLCSPIAGEAEKGLAKKSPRRIGFNPTMRSHEQRRASGEDKAIAGAALRAQTPTQWPISSQR